MLQRNSHWNTCLFIICFLYYKLIFSKSLLHFHVNISLPFALNAVWILCFETLYKLYKFFFLFDTNWINWTNFKFSCYKFQKVNERDFFPEFQSQKLEGASYTWLITMNVVQKYSCFKGSVVLIYMVIFCPTPQNDKYKNMCTVNTTWYIYIHTLL